MGVSFNGLSMPLENGFKVALIKPTLTWTSPAEGSFGQYIGNTEFPATPLNATSSQGGTVTFTVVDTLPTGLSIVNGVLSGTLANEPGTKTFTIRANDGFVTADRTFSVLVIDSGANWGAATRVSTTYDALGTNQYFGYQEGARPSANGQWMAVPQMNHASRKVLVYKRDGDGWVFDSLVTPPSGTNNQANAAVAVSNNGLMVAFSMPGYNNTGAIAVLRRTSEGQPWTGGVIAQGGNNSRMGDTASFDMNDDGTVIVAGQSTVNVATAHRWNGTSWQTFSLPPGEDIGYYGGMYGGAVTVSGDGQYLCVSARRMYRTGIDSAPSTGKLYVFNWNGSTYTNRTVIQNMENTTMGALGVDVRMNYDGTEMVAVGTGTHKARYFTRSGSAWTMAGTMTTTATMSVNEFNGRCDIQGEYAVVCERGGFGSVAVFRKPAVGTAWLEVARFDGTESGEGFGYRAFFAGSDKYLLITTQNSTQGAFKVGKAYMYKA